MLRSARLTLGQYLTILVVALVVLLQMTNLVVTRVAAVQRHFGYAESRDLHFASRMLRSMLQLPQAQRAAFADAASDLTFHAEYGAFRPLLAGDARRPEAEAKALVWFQKMGLPVAEVVMTERAYPSPLPPPGISSKRSMMLSLGAPKRTLFGANRPIGQPPRWAVRERAAPPDDFRNLIRTKPRAEVHRLAIRHANSGDWVTIFSLRRLPPVNDMYTNLLVSTVISGLLASLVLLIGHRVMQPVRQLANEAERLGRGDSAAILEVRGPRDTCEIITSFNRMNERVTQSVDYQIGLLRSLGHDLKGPLSGVKQLVTHVDPMATREQIDARLRRVEGIVDSIMAFSRAVMRDGEFQSVDLTQLLEVVVENQADLGCDAVMGASASVFVTCRVSALQRCLSNLVENACRYGGQAQAKVFQDQDDAVVVIEDDGPGIPEDDLVRVFEPFQRLDETKRGSGLGLAIAKTIVVDQGGTIQLFNRAEGGLRVEIRLPRTRKL